LSSRRVSGREGPEGAFKKKGQAAQGMKDRGFGDVPQKKRFSIGTRKRNSQILVQKKASVAKCLAERRQIKSSKGIGKKRRSVPSLLGKRGV